MRIISIKYLTVVLMVSLSINSQAQLSDNDNESLLAGHQQVLDAKGNLQAWYMPENPGAAFIHVSELASTFIKEGTPIDPKTELPLYMISCCFQGPHMRTQEDFDKGITWEDWMHNPACVFAGMMQSLVIDYRVYSGDDSYIEVVRSMLDFQLKNGTTPDHFRWSKVPYASSNPGETIYEGATKWENDGMRGDGLHGIEPDKIGELGVAYLNFYEVTEETKYLDAAMDCANALALHVRDVTVNNDPFSATQTSLSPWPFRVNARTGLVIDQYCSNVIESIRLFDELLRIKSRIALHDTLANSYQKTRDIAWDWLYSKNGPMKTGVWNGYFEDIPNDTKQTNRVQITPMETARYLIQHPDLDPDLNNNVPALLYWVAGAFGTEGMDAIKEQTWCYEPIGSHSARYASVCALWYEYTGDKKFKEEAYKFFNFASYMTDDNGVVRVGPNWPGSWFSDGYGDYIRHFMEGVAAVPEWAPANENHLLKSTSVIQKISYESNLITYTTFDKNAKSTLRMQSKPKQISVDGSVLNKTDWSWKKLDDGGVCIVNQHGGFTTKISF